MKTFFRILQSFVVLFVLLFLITSLAAGPDTAFRMFYYNTTDIDDYKIFPSRTLHAGAKQYPFKTETGSSRVPSAYQDIPLDVFLEDNGTVAFIVLKEDALLYERYFGGYSASTPIQAFSMSKSLFSILVGRAVDDGYFSVNQPVTDFVPELAANGFDRVTIEHMLQMASGSNYRQTGFNELSPFSLHPRFEYSPRLENEIITTLEVIHEPGTEFIYKSGDTALLSLVLTRALKNKTIADYMQEALWTPLGMEYDGYYTIDHAGADALEKTWCCLAATARDFAKFGLLMLNAGNWNGSQIVSSDWIRKSTHIDPADTRRADSMMFEAGVLGYQYQWWLAAEDEAYFGAGHLGQYLYVNPARRVVIVRLGREGDDAGLWLGLFAYLAQNIR